MAKSVPPTQGASKFVSESVVRSKNRQTTSVPTASQSDSQNQHCKLLYIKWLFLSCA